MTTDSGKKQYFVPLAYGILLLTIVLPFLISTAICKLFSPQPQTFHLIKSFSLLLLGLFLSALATLNFSLSFIIGLLCAPLSFVGSPVSTAEEVKDVKDIKATTEKNNTATKRSARVLALSSISLVLLNLLSPAAVLLTACWYTGVPVQEALTQAAFGWDVWGLWTPVIVCCVWWPAWLTGAVLVASNFFV